MFVWSGAEFSEDRKYRYKLWRGWNLSLPRCFFIMLNPSIADENILDPTIKKCVGFAKRWDCGSIYIGNIFSLVSTDPNELYRSDEPIGSLNDEAIKYMVSHSDMTVAAWGSHGKFMERGNKVMSMLNNVYVLRMNKDGQPAHPLYIPYSCEPFNLINKY